MAKLRRGGDGCGFGAIPYKGWWDSRVLTGYLEKCRKARMPELCVSGFNITTRWTQPALRVAFAFDKLLPRSETDKCDACLSSWPCDADRQSPECRARPVLTAGLQAAEWVQHPNHIPRYTHSRGCHRSSRSIRDCPATIQPDGLRDRGDHLARCC